MKRLLIDCRQGVYSGKSDCLVLPKNLAFGFGKSANKRHELRQKSTETPWRCRASPELRPDLDSAYLKTPEKTFCLTILTDFNFSLYSYLLFWVIIPDIKKKQLSVSQHSSVVLYTPDWRTCRPNDIPHCAFRTCVWVRTKDINEKLSYLIVFCDRPIEFPCRSFTPFSW